MPTNYMQVFEGEAVPLRDRPDGSGVLPSSSIPAIHHLSKNLSGSLVQWGYKQVSFKRCGFIYFSDCFIEILPNAGASANAREIFSAMMGASGRFVKSTAAYRHKILADLTFFDRYIFQFCEELNYQLKKGMIKHYVQYQQQVPVVRGRLVLDQQLYGTMQESTVCEYDELSLDNLHNRILKKTLKLLSKLSYHAKIKRKVRELLDYFSGISDQVVQWRDVTGLSYDRSNKRYQPLFEQCRTLLSNCEFEKDGEGIRYFSYLEDMEALFKSGLIASLHNLAIDGLNFKSGAPRKVVATTENKTYGVLKPDLCLMDDDNRMVSLGKVIWKNEPDPLKALSEQEWGLILCYASCFQLDKVFLLLPRFSPGPIMEQLRLNGSDIRVSVIYIDLNHYPMEAAQLAAQFKSLGNL